MKTHKTLSLGVIACRVMGGVANDNDADLAPLPHVQCQDPAGILDMAPLPSPPKAKDWAVNGIPGGSRTVGTISGNGWIATYKAPSAKPTPDTVEVSVTVPSDRGKTKLASKITIKDRISYSGTVQFSIAGVSGSANVTWTEFENPEDEDSAQWYLPSGTIMANVDTPGCDPQQIAGPIATGSLQEPKGGSMTIFPVTHPGQPRRYMFGLVGDRTNNINLYCGSPPNRRRIPVSLSHFVNFTTGTCRYPHEPYNDTLLLEGERKLADCRMSWKFTAQ